MPNHPNPITVIRLGYRVGRDPRINTHLGLVSRALGADEFLVSGDKNNKMFDKLTKQFYNEIKKIKTIKIDIKKKDYNSGNLSESHFVDEKSRKALKKVKFTR